MVVRNQYPSSSSIIISIVSRMICWRVQQCMTYNLRNDGVGERKGYHQVWRERDSLTGSTKRSRRRRRPVYQCLPVPSSRNARWSAIPQGSQRDTATVLLFSGHHCARHGILHFDVTATTWTRRRDTSQSHGKTRHK